MRRDKCDEEKIGIEISNEEGFYTDDEIERLLEDDEISLREEAFMRGYMGEFEEQTCGEISKDRPISNN